MPEKERAKEIILTPEGLKKLEEKLDLYKTTHRREVAERIRQAKEYGDITENSEYEDAKMEQAFIEGEILALETMIRNARILDEKEIHTDLVSVGSIVKLKNLDTNKDETYTIVGTAESNLNEAKISNESPVGKALLGKHKGDKVNAKVPKGTVNYKVVSIQK